MNGLRLCGGEASTGPHRIDRNHDTLTRQRKRRERQVTEVRAMRAQFGLHMLRRVQRAIAFTKARKAA